ncbi:MAG: hypothetical protein NW224_25790 [Leptolyngbyaceae cyanobacterium bins.302]|nr:hypothetical protein [Leptolyngbyaceae cyanobacterium bins.302]
MSTRTELLTSLLNFDQPLRQITSTLATFGWDSNRSLVVLNQNHIAMVLTRYLNGELSEVDVEGWANAIEGREDITYKDDIGDELNDVIYQLANPLLTVPMSETFAKALLKQLSEGAIV